MMAFSENYQKLISTMSALLSALEPVAGKPKIVLSALFTPNQYVLNPESDGRNFTSADDMYLSSDN
jgi:hypothetical protein